MAEPHGSRRTRALGNGLSLVLTAREENCAGETTPGGQMGMSYLSLERRY